MKIKINIVNFSPNRYRELILEEPVPVPELKKFDTDPSLKNTLCCLNKFSLFN